MVLHYDDYNDGVKYKRIEASVFGDIDTMLYIIKKLKTMGFNAYTSSERRPMYFMDMKDEADAAFLLLKYSDGFYL